MARYHNVLTPLEPPKRKHTKAELDLIVKRVESRLGRSLINNTANLCVDCNEGNKEGYSRPQDGAFLCQDCITFRASKFS